MLSKVSVWVYCTDNWICVLDIKAYNDQGCTEIETDLLSSAEEFKQSAQTIQPRKNFSKRNNKKYIDRRSNSVINSPKIMNEQKNSSINCVSITQVQWNIKRLFKTNTGIFGKSWNWKNKLLLQKVELNHIF